MTIAVDARSHKTQTVPFPVDPVSFNTDSSWTHHGGTPQGVVAIVIAEGDVSNRSGHDDEVVGCTYGGEPMVEITGSPFIQTLTGTAPFDANGFVWDGKWWTYHAFYMSGCVPAGDQTFAIDLGPGTVLSTYQCEVWTFTSDLGGIDYEAPTTYEASTDHPSYSITSSHAGVVLSCMASDANGATTFTKTSGGTQVLLQDYGVVTAAWVEQSGAAGSYTTSYTVTSAFSTAPLQPCIGFGFVVYGSADLTCPEENAAYWGVLSTVI